MEILKIFEDNPSYLAIVAIFIIFLLGLKKNKNKKPLELVDKGENNDVDVDVDVDVDALKKYEEKLIVLKDLYKQELIDSNLYKKKIELIVKRVGDMYGKDFNKFPKFQQKIVMDSLKKDIKSKVRMHTEFMDEKSIDSLIDAVDKKIDRSKKI